MSLAGRIFKRIKKEMEFKKKFQDYQLQRFVRNKSGIEIGGPTDLFAGSLPMYQVVKQLDGCNFSINTVWEGNIAEGETYHYYSGKSGFQYICEANELKSIESEKYDFLLSSHCLEHCANALKTVGEWIRVIKPRGYLLLVLPDKRFTFDHNRAVTSLQHLLDDFHNQLDEHDLTHLEEILELHDLDLDIPAGDITNFKKRSADNFNNRCLHHHVFDADLLVQICQYFKLKVKLQKWVEPYHQIIIAQKRS